MSETLQEIEHGLTPREFGAYYRLSPDFVRSLIMRGRLGAINTARNRMGKPRFIILPRHAREWEEEQRAVPAVETPRRRKRLVTKDFYPD